MQLSRLDPRHGERFVAKAQRHQYAADKCLAALRLSGETCQLATGIANLRKKRYLCSCFVQTKSVRIITLANNN